MRHVLCVTATFGPGGGGAVGGIPGHLHTQVGVVVVAGVLEADWGDVAGRIPARKVHGESDVEKVG